MADRYWVGGTGNWSDTAHWSTTSGGASGATVPTAADNAIFNAASNATAYAVTVDVAATCLDLNFAAAPSGSGTISWAGTASLDPYGNVTLLAGMTRTYNGSFSLHGSGKTITTNGVTLAGIEGFVGCSITQADALTVSGTFRVGNSGPGAWNTAGFAHTSAAFIISASAITFGTSVITTNNYTVLSGATISAASSTINVSTASTNLFSSDNATYGTVTITFVSTQAGTIQGAHTFTNLTIIGPGGKTASCSLNGNHTVTGTLTITGNSAVNRLLVKSNSIGVACTITAAAVALNHADFQDIAGAGAASPFAAATPLGDCLGNSGITLAASVTQYWKTTTTGTKFWSTAANWFLGTNGSGGAGRVPLPQDDVVFDASSIGATLTVLTMDMPRCGKDITFTGVTNSPSQSTDPTDHTFYGSVTLSAGMNNALGGSWNYEGRTNITFTTAGSTIPNLFTTNSFAGTLTLNGNLVCANTGTSFSSYAGSTFDAAGFNVTLATFRVDNATINMGTGTWTLSGGGTVWDYRGGVLNASTSTLRFTSTAVGDKTFAGFGRTYNNVWVDIANNANFIVTGANTFNDFKVSAGLTVNFTAATTNTMASLTSLGSAGNNVTIGSATAAGHTLAKSGGGFSNVDFLTLSRSTASPAYAFRAGPTFTDGGNNVNWGFVYAGVASAAGTAADSWIGRSVRVAVAAASGVATESWVGRSVFAVVANAVGSSVVTGVGRTISHAVAAAAGMARVFGRSLRIPLARILRVRSEERTLVVHERRTDA